MLISLNPILFQTIAATYDEQKKFMSDDMMVEVKVVLGNIHQSYSGPNLESKTKKSAQIPQAYSWVKIIKGGLNFWPPRQQWITSAKVQLLTRCTEDLPEYLQSHPSDDIDDM